MREPIMIGSLLLVYSLKFFRPNAARSIWD